MQGICSTCLCSDRKVRQLDSFPVKNTLWEWFDVGGSGNFNVNLDEFKLCWECNAMLRKINQFKKQVFKAQKIRLKVERKKSRHLTNLSKLSTYTKNTYDFTYKHIEGPNGFKPLKPKPEPKPDDTLRHVPNVARKREKMKSENGKHRTMRTPLPYINKNKEKQKIEGNDYKKEHKALDSDSTSDESYIKIKTTDESKTNETNSSDSSVVKKKEKPKTRNGKHTMSIVPHKHIDKKKQTNVRKSSIGSKIKHKKRKHIDNPSDDERDRKRPKREREVIKVDLTGGTSNDSDLELPEVKFTIVHLNEEQMLKNRDIDRNGRIYMGGTFKCESCIVGFSNKTHYEKHNNEKHSELVGKLMCPICNIRFVKKGFLKLHQDNHYRSYRCRQCNFEHHRRYVIDSHVVKEHDLKPSPVCLACDIEFDSKLLLIHHYETVHEEVLKYRSREPSVLTFKADVKIKEPKEGKVEPKEGKVEPKEGSNTKNNNVEIMKCSLCDRTFDGKSSYRAHIQFAHRNLAENAYCTDCDLQFSSVDKYKSHLDDKHRPVEKLVFDCSYCSSNFPNKDYLLAHIVRAHRLLSHTCALCNKGFSDPDRLKNHIELKHPEVIKSPKTKKCPICSKDIVGSSDPDCIKNHIEAKHPNDIKSPADKKCPICSKGFITRSALLNHIRTHTAEKPYQCEQCEKRFAIKTMLNKHIQRMHQLDDDNN